MALANSSSVCEDDLLWPGSQVCDAAGTCLANGLCLCDAGWSGSGDFTTSSRSGRACDINESVVRSMWIVMGVLHAVALPFALNVIQYELSMLCKSRGMVADHGQKMVVATKLAAYVHFLSPFLPSFIFLPPIHHSICLSSMSLPYFRHSMFFFLSVYLP
jgi:hypothetical protein